MLLEDTHPEHPFSLDFCRFADKNDLLLAVGTKNGPWHQIPEPYGTRYSQKLKLYKHSYEMFGKFIERCVKYGYSVFTIKSFLPFPYADSNIDFVVVQPQNQDVYITVLNDLGYKRFRSLADIREPNKQMYTYRIEDSNYPKLHLHKSLSWNGITYLNKIQVWDRHRYIRINGLSIPIPSAEDELLIMAAHAVFENKYISLGELLHLINLLESSLDWDYILRVAEENSWITGLRLFLSITSRMGEELGYTIGINQDLVDKLKVGRLDFPFMLPFKDTLQATFSKLALDFRFNNIGEIPRELFTYLMVDLIWMYYKAVKKIKG